MQNASLPRISTFAVFLPQYARGQGRFIKHEAYRSQRERELIIAKNQRYLERHRHKLKVFELYEQPGNQRIFRWPEEPILKFDLVLWLCFLPEVSAKWGGDADGCKRIWRSYGLAEKDLEQHHFAALLDMVRRHIEAYEIWIAHIYLHPGNELRFAWNAQDGETFPGNALPQALDS